MLKIKHRLALLCGLFLLPTAFTLGDILKFPNGDVLTGTFISEDDGIIVFSNPMLGEIQVPAAEVELVLVDTDAAAMPTAEEVAVETQVAVDIPEADDAVDDPLADRSAFDRSMDRARDYFNYIIPDGWTGRLAFGVAFTETNTKTEDWNLNLRARKESGKNRYRTHWYYEYKTQTNQANVTTRQLDKYGANFIWQRDLYDKFFFQSVSGYLSDRVKQIRHEATQSVGIGYRVYDTDKLKLSFTPSATAQYKDGPGIDRRWIGYATLFQDLEYHINETLRIEQTAEGSVNPTRTSEYEYAARIALIAKLTDWIDASLSYENNYDATVGAGGNRREERIIFALGIPF